MDSLKEYFSEVHDDRLLAMAVNPLLATRGFEDVIALMDNEDDEDDEGKGKQLVDKGKSLLKKAVIKVTQAIKERSSHEVEVNEPLGKSLFYMIYI